MTKSAKSAIVLGGSMSGLLSARVLSARCDHVTLIERDPLDDAVEVRKGVPQAAHAHGLLTSGYRVMHELFPGLMDELVAAGARRGDVIGDFLWFQYGRWKLRYKSGLDGIVVSRPCLESAIRRRVRALRNVTILDGASALRPLFDAAAGRVTGLAIKRADGTTEELSADLTIDASGRGSQSPKWLDEWGFGQVPTKVVRVDVGYATRVFERRPGDFFNSTGGVIAGTPPVSTRYAAVLAAEHDRWVVTLAGMLADYPPLDVDEWMAYAATLPVPAVHDLAAAATPLGGVTGYRFPANQWRLFERMRRFPEGYAVLGDAVCSFNPIYGQGMSSSAMQAKALDETLSEGGSAVGQRLARRVAKVADVAWTIATGEDLKYPSVEGPRPPAFALVNRYLNRVHAVASDDEVVCRRFFDVLNLLAPAPALMKPSVAWRVLSHRVPLGPGSPWGRRTPAAARPPVASA